MMERFVKKAVEEYALLLPGESVLCALSGGTDSVALVRCLLNMGYQVSACHFNHSLRGAESEGDEAFCRDFCRENAVKLYVTKEDIRGYAENVKESIETAARIRRYAFFEHCAQQAGILKIATAHTASDNLETQLFHLIRGTGLKGLCGIPPARRLSGGALLIRPLIFAQREDITDYLRQLGQDYREDSSNLTDDYTRNRIRHQVIPALKEIAPDAASAAANAAMLLRRDEAFLSSLAFSSGSQIEVKQLLQAAQPIAARILRNMMQSAGVPMGEVKVSHLDNIIKLLQKGNPYIKLNLPGGYFFVRRYETVFVEQGEKKKNFQQTPLLQGETVQTPLCSVSLSICDGIKANVFNNSFNTFYLDCGKINVETLCVRPRRQGDCLAIHKGGGHKSLKKWMIEKKIPRDIRDILPVVADSSGVIAVYRLGADIARTADGECQMAKLKFTEN